MQSLQQQKNLLSVVSVLREPPGISNIVQQQKIDDLLIILINIIIIYV